MSSGYNLEDPHSPIVSGRSLAILCNVIEQVGELSGITQYLCKDAGLHVLRNTEYDEPPTTTPIWAPTQEMVAASVPDSTTSLSPAEYLAAIMEQADKEVDSPTLKTSGGHKFLSCRDYYVAYKSKKTTPTMIAEQLLGNIEESGKISPPLGALWSWRVDFILKQAKASTLRYSEGRPKSIVDGVPVVIKDEIDVEGLVTGVGTSFLNRNSPALEDAFLVKKLRQLGAIIIGKSTMHEIGLGVTNFNPSTATPRNPYNPEHSTGGSSGGSGAAVAAGLVPIAIGCDGGGSIRIPAAYCGIYGLKPTHGRISSRGEYPLAPTVAVSGPMCATMEDLNIVYAIVSGPEDRDTCSQIQPDAVLPIPAIPGQKGQLEGLRIGVPRKWFEDVLHKEISDACYKMLDTLCKDQGAVLVDIQIPELFENAKAHNITIVAEMLGKRYRYKLNHQTRMELALMDSLGMQDYVRAQQQRTRSIRHLQSTFGQKKFNEEHRMAYPSFGHRGACVDIIVTPSTANLPPKISGGALSYGESNFVNNVKTMQYMMMANLTGIPGISAVAGYTKEEYVHSDGQKYQAGLPIGIQFMSQWWDEKTLLKIGSLCEEVLGEERQQPKVWFGNYDLTGNTLSQ
ncbi:hypothetical protein BGZ74_006897 [Mortierella antarctica]|nr:hypothetical protein BGZ74_006897 [Mortierella antarctica]